MKNITRICILNSIILFFCLMPLSGCTSNKETIEGRASASWLETSLFQECDSPCWLGIKPGETSKDDAISILISYYGEGSIKETHPSFIQWQTSGNRPSKSGDISFVDDIVNTMSVRFDENKVTINDIIAVINTPDQVRLITLSSFSSEIPQKKACADSWLVYFDFGLEVHPLPLRGFTPTQSVSELVFVSHQVATKWTNPDPNSILVQWDGFHDYCLLYENS